MKSVILLTPSHYKFAAVLAILPPFIEQAIPYSPIIFIVFMVALVFLDHLFLLAARTKQKQYDPKEMVLQAGIKVGLLGMLAFVVHYLRLYVLHYHNIPFAVEYGLTYIDSLVYIALLLNELLSIYKHARLAGFINSIGPVVDTRLKGFDDTTGQPIQPKQS